MGSKDRLLYGLNDKPGFWVSVFMGLQNVALVFSGSVVMPIIICKTTNTPPAQTEYIIFATIVLTAFSSFIQIRKFGKIGAGYLIFVGSSGAYWGAVASTVDLKGWAFVAALSLLSAPIEILLSYTYKYFRKIITPMVGGIVILMIAISIMPLMMEMWTGKPSSADYCSGNRFLIGGVTMVTILIIASLRKAKLRIWSILIGMLAGTIVSIFTGDFNQEAMQSVSWVGLPKGEWQGIDFDFSPTTLTLLFSFIIATIASTVESIGDSITVQKLSNPNFKKVDYESVQGCLYSDALGTMLSGLAGTVPNTTYSGNIAAIKLTGVASKKVGYYGVVILLLLAFFPKIAYLLIYIPEPILGASSIVILGTLASASIQLIGQERLDYRKSIVVGVSISVGILASRNLLFPAIIPEGLRPLLSDGIVISGFVAIIFNSIYQLTATNKIKFQLVKDTAQVHKLQKEIEKNARTLKLNDEVRFKLELVLEELFVFICSQSTSHESRKVRFVLSYDSEKVDVEITDREKLEDVDLTEYDPGIIETNFEKLGLVIANKFSDDLKHIRISNENFITFNIPN